MVARCCASLLLVLFCLPAIAVEPAEPVDFDKAFLGIVPIDVPKEPIVEEGLKPTPWPTRRGAVIGFVFSGSPAADKELGRFDVVIQVDGKPIASARDYEAAKKQLKPGVNATLVVRDSRRVGDRIAWRRSKIVLAPITLREFLRGQMVADEDELGQRTLYRHREERPAMESQTGVWIDVVQEKERWTPVLRLVYRAQDWLFFDAATFLIDGQQYRVEIPRHFITRDNTAGEVWEWCSLPVILGPKPKVAGQALLDLEECEKAKVFFHGEDYREEHEIGIEQRLRLQVAMLFYHAQSGE